MKNALWLFSAATLILAVFFPSFVVLQQERRRNTEYEQQIAQLKAKNRQLEEEKRLLLENPVYLERVAREKMGLVREGEVIYRLTPVEQEE